MSEEKEIGIGVSGALFSEDREYRFALWRIWTQDKPKVLFIGINPSSADEIKDDQTIRKCASYAQRWGYGGIFMGNLYARCWYYPNISELTRKESITWLKHNDKALKSMSDLSEMVVACWGSVWKGCLDRCESVLELFDKVYCLKRVKNGQPSHPLYLPVDIEPQVYREVLR